MLTLFDVHAILLFLSGSLTVWLSLSGSVAHRQSRQVLEGSGGLSVRHADA